MPTAAERPSEVNEHGMSPWGGPADVARNLDEFYPNTDQWYLDQARDHLLPAGEVGANVVGQVVEIDDQSAGSESIEVSVSGDK